jgi:drug/metabolite transporter (DMT)-like permease
VLFRSFDPNFFSIFSRKYAPGWLWMGLSGTIALGIGDYFGLKMYTILSPRYGSVLTTLAPAMALMMGIILLDEHMNFIGICGMLITILGVTNMSLGRKERSSIPDHGHGSIYKGIIFGLILAACNGCALAISKKGFMEQASSGEPLHPITGSFIRYFIATVIVVVFMLLKKILVKNIRNIFRQPMPVLQIAGLGVLLGPLLALSFAMFAIQTIDVAVTQTIFSLVPVVTLLISHFILKEKITWNSLIGVSIAVTGVCILIWRESILQLVA